MGVHSKPEAIIFDFDGTLVDSERITFDLAVPIISKYLGREISREELSSIKGRVWKTAFKKWLPRDHEKVYQEIVDNWRAVNPALPIYPDIREMLSILHERGFKMAIASSRERNLIAGDLKRLSIEGYFETVIGQEDTILHKPEPEPLLMASRQINVRADLCIYIGDQVSDITASKSAGMLSGGASWGEGIHNILNDARPDFLFTKPSEVPVFLQH